MDMIDIPRQEFREPAHARSEEDSTPATLEAQQLCMEVLTHRPLQHSDLLTPANEGDVPSGARDSGLP